MYGLVAKLIVIMLISGQCCFAAQNFLNSVVFEQVDGQSNIVLRTDGIARVKKTVQSNDRITLTITGITPSTNMSTVYKNFNGMAKIVSEDAKNGELKLHIISPNAANANIIFNTPDSAPIYVGERFGQEKANWALTTLIFAGLFLVTTSHRTRKRIKRRELRDREIEFYKAKLPSMNYKPTMRYAMNSIQKEQILR